MGKCQSLVWSNVLYVNLFNECATCSRTALADSRLQTLRTSTDCGNLEKFDIRELLFPDFESTVNRHPKNELGVTYICAGT